MQKIPKEHMLIDNLGKLWLLLSVDVHYYIYIYTLYANIFRTIY